MTRHIRSTIALLISFTCLLVMVWAVCGTGPQIVGGDEECTLDAHAIKAVVIIFGIVSGVSGLVSNLQNREMLREARNRISVLEIQNGRSLCELRDETKGRKTATPTCA